MRVGLTTAGRCCSVSSATRGACTVRALPGPAAFCRPALGTNRLATHARFARILLEVHPRADDVPRLPPNPGSFVVHDYAKQKSNQKGVFAADQASVSKAERASVTSHKSTAATAPQSRLQRAPRHGAGRSQVRRAAARCARPRRSCGRAIFMLRRAARRHTCRQADVCGRRGRGCRATVCSARGGGGVVPWTCLRDFVEIIITSSRYGGL